VSLKWGLFTMCGGRFILAAGPALLLGGGANYSYMGIPLARGTVRPELQQLANLARTGDKQARLNLGIRFEERRGMPVNVSISKKLYRSPATDSGGTLWICSPPVGNRASGRVVLVEGEPKDPVLTTRDYA